MKRSGTQEFRSLEDVLVHELEDLYDAEKQILNTFPKAAQAAHTPALVDILQKEAGEASRQLRRMEDLFVKLNQRREGQPCEGMTGLIKECENAVAAKGDSDAKDAAIISAIQRIKHYEIAGYGSARTFASRLGRHDLARELQYTLQEEIAADRKLTEVAEAEVNAAAVH